MNSDKPPAKKIASPHRGRDLTTGSIPRHLLAFGLPMLAGSALQTAYSFINAIWVGQFLGTSNLAAVTVSFPVIFVLIALAGGLTLASNILIAQYFGAKNQDKLRKVVQNSVILISTLSLFLLLVGEIFAPHILQAMDTPPEVLSLATGYMRIFLISIPFAFGVFLVSSMLRGIGDSTTPLYFQTISVICNAILDPLLMFGLFGLPRLGLNGTAWATVITQAGAVIGVFYYMQRKRSLVSPAWKRLKSDLETVWLIIKIGVPSAVQQSLVSFGMVFVIGIVNGFGQTATAAFGAASRFDQLAFLPAMTLGMAVSTLSGQNIGARKFARVNETFRWGVLFSSSFTLVAAILALSIPHLVLRIFTNDPDVMRLGVDYLRTVGATYVIFAVTFPSNGVINGAGHTFMTTVISLVSLWFFRVPLAYYLSRRLHSVQGVWDAMAISFVVSMLVSVSYYFSGRWKSSRILVHQLPPSDPSGIVGDEMGEM